MTDYFKCPDCGKVIDEFQEKDYRFMKGMREIERPKSWIGSRDFCYACAIEELHRMKKEYAHNTRLVGMVFIIAVSITVVAIVNYVLGK